MKGFSELKNGYIQKSAGIEYSSRFERKMAFCLNAIKTLSVVPTGLESKRVLRYFEFLYQNVGKCRRFPT